MGAFKQPGRKLVQKRIDVRAEQELIDETAIAAQAMGQSMSAYIREAVTEKLIRDGFRSPTDRNR
jgi:predicted HicB family RNase H-like nuclease